MIRGCFHFGVRNMSEKIEIHPAAENAASPSAAASASINCSFDLADLDPALLLAAERRLAIAPVLTHSWHASPHSFISELSNEIGIIAQASARYPTRDFQAKAGNRFLSGDSS
jgi:hypothetical protein